jgi:hypothetical protein
MEQVYLVIAMLTAGVSLISGINHLLTGLHRDGEKMDLVFGILALSIFLFLMLPPIGFILADMAQYKGELIIKRIFIFSFYILLPWFIELYSGYKQRLLNYTIWLLLALITWQIIENVDGKPY